MISMDVRECVFSVRGALLGKKEERVSLHEARSHPDEGDQFTLHLCMSKEMKDPRFSSSFSVVFLNFFHHDASSRLEGGESAPCVITGVGAPRCAVWFTVCCVVIDAELPVAIKRRQKVS
jgi:hypothetical protein